MTNRRDFICFAGATVAAMSSPAIESALSAGEGKLGTRPIPGTNEPLPIVGLGNAAPFGSGDLAASRQLLEIFIDRGGAYVDTLGPSRFTVAQIVNEKNAREQTFLGTYVAGANDQAVRQDIEALRAAQGGGSLDLVLTRNVADYSTRRSEFRRLKDHCLTRYVGVARHQEPFHEPMMKLIDADAVDFVQVNYSMLEPEAESRLLPMAQDKGVAIVINRPFINGRWFSIVKDKTLPEWAAEFDCDSWAQFSLKFILSHPAVNCVLTETSNPKHAIDNIGGGIGRLPDEKTRLRMRELVRGFV